MSVREWLAWASTNIVVGFLYAAVGLPLGFLWLLPLVVALPYFGVRIAYSWVWMAIFNGCAMAFLGRSRYRRAV